ncbi:MAG: tRNA pseudouridine(55) synthase TruB [Candidatus Rokuibacteriota bacterium]
MARPRVATHSGVLVVDKAPGLTSFDVVARARRALGERRIGHGGTLDPGAVGVLPLLVGEATKMMAYLVEQEKEYVAIVRLGVATDTHDLSGRIVATRPVPALDRGRLERVLGKFVGRIRQAPPMYSAVHHEGRRLYELARQGVEVVREAREVVVHAIELLDVMGDRIRLRVVCGKGTYLRAIAADVGEDLGCGGALEHLTRVRVGPFTRAAALPSDDLTRLERPALLARLLAVDAPLSAWPAIGLDARDAAAFAHGQPVPLPRGRADQGSFVRIQDHEGRFLGVGVAVAGGTRIRPERIVHADRPGHRVRPA